MRLKMLVCFAVAVVLMALPAGAPVAGSLDNYYLSAFDAVYGQHAARALAQVSPAAVPSGRTLTSLYHDVKRDWKELQPETQVALAKYLAKPTELGEQVFTSAGGHFAVHYATFGSNAPDLSDGNANGVPDWVETVAATFEHVYQVEVGEMGYRQAATTAGAPYDVYLQDLSGAGEYGYTDSLSAVTPGSTSYTSYIVLDKSMTNPIYAPYSGLVGLQITAAHEYHHAVQYTYNYFFEIWYGEATSTWLEDEVYDGGNQLYSYLPAYFQNSTKAIDIPANVGTGGGYARWLFNRFLAEKYGSGVLKAFWERLALVPAPGDGSDIPALQVLADTVRTSYSGDLGHDFLSFAKRVYLREWGTHTNDLGLIASYSPEATYTQYPVQGSSFPAPESSLGRYSFAYYRFLPSPSAPADLEISVSAAGLSTVAFKKSSNGTITEYQADPASGTITIPAFNASDTTEAVLLVANTTSYSATASFSTTGSSTVSAAASTGGGRKSGCFIATAAYGSYLHPKVMVLREFRDRYLLTNAPGRAFVAFYYRTSPPIADFIARHEIARALCRFLLAPVIAAVEFKEWTLSVVLLFILALAARPVLRRHWGTREAREC